MTSIGSRESWEVAQNLASNLGEVPSLFSAAIRTLIVNQRDNNGVVSPGGRHCLRTLLRGQSLKASLYYAALTFREDRLQEDSFKRTSNLAKVFNPEELAYLVGAFFAFRRAQKLMRREETHWPEIYKELALEIDLGGFIGEAIPKIGFARGMFIPCVRHLSQTVFLANDPKKFAAYRTNLKKSNLSYDLNEEFEKWGCTHLQVATILAQRLCVGKTLPQALFDGLSTSYLDQQLEDKEALSIQVLKVWIDSFKETGEVPDMTHRGEFYPKSDDLDLLKDYAESARSSGSDYHWLKKGKDDINVDEHPELFVKGDFSAPDMLSMEELEAEVIGDELLEELRTAEGA